MPSIDANLKSWDQDWGHDGDEWSQAWGSTESMWRGSILPRIGRYLPADSVLEIAPGRGRVSEFLLPQCKQYVGLDLAVACVEACNRRFADVAHARFVTTDGKTLAGVGDASIDFAFSWDSLVHADAAVLRSYLAELTRVLRPGGAAFLHHSNLGAFVDETTGKPTVDNPHWRDPTVSAALIERACNENGLRCCVQELLQWGVPYYNDCFTLLQKPSGASEAPTDLPLRLEHPSMNAEMMWCRSLSQSYWRSWD